MHFQTPLLLFLLRIIFVFTFQKDLVVNQSNADVSVVLCKIITNFLVKYISDKQIFVSIIIPSSKNQHNHLKENVCSNLFFNAGFPTFDYNIVGRLVDYLYTRHSFNLILTDDYASIL